MKVRLPSAMVVKERGKRLLNHSRVHALATICACRLGQRFVRGRTMAYAELPPTLHLETTTRCNARCIFCAHRHMTRAQSVMSMDRFVHAVDQYRKMGGARVSLTGIVGDPLMDPLLIKRLDYLDQCLDIQSFYFFTNGINLNEYDASRMLRYGKKFRISVSLGGFDRRTYACIMGVDCFDKVVKNLVGLIEDKSECSSLVAVEIHLRCPVRCLTGPIWEKFRHYEQKKLIQLVTVMDYDPWAGRVETNAIRKAGLTAKLMPYKLGPCIYLYTKPVVLPDGKVNGCACRDVEAELIIGDLAKSSLEKIWRGKRRECLIAAQEKGYYPAVCEKCTHYVSIFNPLRGRFFSRI